MEVNLNLTEKAQRDLLIVAQALENGDQKSYAKLMSLYKDAIYFMMLKMTNNPDDAEDMTIEAFGKAFKRLKQYTPEYAFSTWLFKIASNNCIDFIRKKKIDLLSINRVYDDEDGVEMSHNLPGHGQDPEEKMIEKQKIKMMRDVVDKLKPHYKTLVTLRYFDELSYEEIADQLSLPLGTVKAQLFRAREFMHSVIRGKEESI